MVLANSHERIKRSITRGLNLSRYHTRLLPASGISRMRRLLGAGPTNGALTCMNSNVGSTPMLGHTSINVTVNKLKDSTTVRTTSMMLVSSSPEGVTLTMGVTEEAVRVTRRGIMFTVKIGITMLVLTAVNLNAV